MRLISKCIIISLAVIFMLLVGHVGILALRWNVGARVGQTGILSSPALATSQAVFALRAHRGDEAKNAAISALSNDPLNVVALRVAGLASDQASDAVSATKFMNLAGQLGWRDPSVQLWIMEVALRNGDWDTAILRADGLARQGLWPNVTNALFLEALKRAPAREALAARLADVPPWRANFFALLGHLDADSRGIIEALLRALGRAGSPATRADLNPYVTGLVGQGHFSEAASIWRRFGLPNGARWDDWPFDGNFSVAQVDGTGDRTIFPFEWRLGDGIGGDSSVEHNGSNAKLVARSDGNAEVLLARQTIILSPGQYRLSGDAEARSGSLATSAFAWTIRCLPAQIPVDGVLHQMAGHFEIEFEVPRSACGAQNMDLNAEPVAPNHDSTAAFGHLKIEPIDK